MRSLLIVLGFLLLTASAAFAGPVVPADIDSQALWYGHVDAEAIMQLPIVKELHQRAINKPKKTIFGKLLQKTAMHLMSEFLDATIYATQYEGDFGVVLMKFRSDLPKESLIAMLAQKYPGHEETMLQNRQVYTWQMVCGRRKMRLSGCFINDRQILVGIDLRHVENALKVLDKERPAMTLDNSLFKGLVPGTLFISRALEVPANYQVSTYCPVLRHCNEAFARWTSHGNSLRGRYEFQATDPEKAALYRQAVEGMKAMFALRFADHDKAMLLLESFTDIQVGKALILTWAGTFDQIKQAFEQIRANRKQQRKMRKDFNKQ